MCTNALYISVCNLSQYRYTHRHRKIFSKSKQKVVKGNKTVYTIKDYDLKGRFLYVKAFERHCACDGSVFFLPQQRMHRCGAVPAGGCGAGAAGADGGILRQLLVQQLPRLLTMQRLCGSGL